MASRPLNPTIAVAVGTPHVPKSSADAAKTKYWLRLLSIVQVTAWVVTLCTELWYKSRFFRIDAVFFLAALVPPVLYLCTLKFTPDTIQPKSPTVVLLIASTIVAVLFGVLAVFDYFSSLSTCLKITDADYSLMQRCIEQRASESQRCITSNSYAPVGYAECPESYLGSSESTAVHVLNGLGVTGIMIPLIWFQIKLYAFNSNGGSAKME